MSTNINPWFKNFRLFPWTRQGMSLAHRASLGERGTPERPDTRTIIYEALQNATVTNCVSFLAKTLADLGFGGHPVLDNSMGPNKYQTQYEFIHCIVTDLLYYGNSFVRVVRTGSGMVVALVPFSPEDVSTNTDEMGSIEYRSERWDGEVLSADEVIHFRDSPDNSILSPSRVTSAYYRIAALTAADRQMDRVFRNGIHFTWVVTSEQKFTPEQAKGLADSLAETYGNYGEGQGSALVLGGGVKIDKQDAASPADQDLRATREDLIREIASLFGVPPFVAGGTGDTRYNNVTARISVLHRETISPIAKNLATKFSQALGVSVSYDLHGLLSGDLATATAVGTQAAGGPFLTVNEVREQQGRERLEMEEYDMIRQSGPMPLETREGEMPTDDGNMTTQPADQ